MSGLVTGPVLAKSLIHTPEYDFLWSNPHLGTENLLFLTFGGSHSYGTNVETSDVDIRGCALNSRSDLLGFTNFEQVVDNKTDTTVYSFNKLVNLMLSCNPNTIEMLGCKPEHYFYLTDIGQEMINNRKMFLSQRAFNTFGGYATQQLRRLKNALARDQYDVDELEEHIRGSCVNAMRTFADRYPGFTEDSLRLFTKVDAASGELRIHADVDMKDVNLRELWGMLSELKETIKNYENGALNHRNSKKDDVHLNKHAMHLIRLYLMCVDLLEKGDIVTYREAEREELLAIRNGKYRTEDGGFRPEFFDMVKEWEKRMEYAKKHSVLPVKPDMKRVEEFVMEVNYRVAGNGYPPMVLKR